MRFIRPDSDEDMFILDKILLAYTKNGEIKKARRLLEKLQKQGALPQSHVEFWKEKIQIIQEKLEAGILPVSENISDCRRNFENVLSQMNESEKEQNSDLIKVFEVMLAQVEPSDLGDKIPDLVILM
jgi:pentatricopeptide repeat protein